MDAKYAGEQALRSSGVDYTIIRPGGLSNGPGGGTAILSDADTERERGGGMISRADVAAVCVAALTSAAARNRTFSVYTKKQALPEGVTYERELERVFADASAE